MKGNHGGENVYNPNGLSPTLLCRDYKDPKRIIEQVPTDNGNITFSPVNKTEKATTTTTGDFYAVTTHPRGTNFTKKRDNYVLKKKDNESDRIIKLNDKAQAQAVYSTEGVGVTLNANGGGQGGKTGLYAVHSENQVEKNELDTQREYDTQIKVGNIYPSHHEQGDVFSTNRIISTITRSNSNRKYIAKRKNYERKKDTPVEQYQKGLSGSHLR